MVPLTQWAVQMAATPAHCGTRPTGSFCLAYEEAIIHLTERTDTHPVQMRAVELQNMLPSQGTNKPKRTLLVPCCPHQ